MLPPFPGRALSCINAAPGSDRRLRFSRLGATKTSTRVLAKMEVTASQRNDFAIGRVIAGLCINHPPFERMLALPEKLQQQGFSFPGPTIRTSLLYCNASSIH